MIEKNLSTDLVIKKTIAIATSCDSILEIAKSKFQQINPSVNFNREMEYALQIFEKNDFLAGVAMRNKQSLYNAFINLASTGLTLAPALKLAYLVPRGKEICLDVSYMGMIRVVRDSGTASVIEAYIVRANDSFDLGSIGCQPIHNYDVFGTIESRGEITGVYAIAKLRDSSIQKSVMSLQEVNEIRNKSESWKNEKARKYSPWFTFPEEMIKKTVIRRLIKFLPISEQNRELVSTLDNFHKEIDFSNSDFIEIDPEKKEKLLKVLNATLANIENGDERLKKWLLAAHKIKCDTYHTLDIEMIEKAILTVKNIGARNEK